MNFNFKNFLITAVCLFSVLIVVPNFLPINMQQKMPAFVQKNLIKLGLDLKGGAYILLEVDLTGIKQDKLDFLEDSMRTMLRGNRDGNRSLIQYSNLASLNKIGVISVNIKDKNQLSEVRSRIRNDFGTDVSIVIDDATGNVRVGYTEDALNRIAGESIDKAIEIVRRRIDSFGTSEASIQKQGANRIMVQLPGVDNPEAIKNLIGQTAKMTFHKVDESVTDVERALPIGTEILPSFDEDNLYFTPIFKRVEISGEHLKDSRATQDMYGRPAVSTVFDNVGSMQFAKLTRENVGRRFAIVLDGKVLSAPVIQEEIPNGTGQISGAFTLEQAAELSLLLRSGALPAPLMVVEERTVGAGLGADSIADGKFASMLGLVLVIITMFLLYMKIGMIANIVLVLNIFIIMAMMSIFGLVLTLPGIAGLVLTMGMSVDAAIIIFERMREEYKSGMSIIAAIDAGFNSAFSSIMDSNITTMVSALLLFQFGSGPVRGFAVTLGIGLFSTVFCFIVVLKNCLRFWAKHSKKAKLPFDIN
ncbi:MAG: protein translocase subunit SecD [Rickettsiales bacterium]|jgi:preprotein translocase subunit SecD|nr:protein translocase subunit SecD [Rickettsiales bacterium]